jgi:methylated-DNA-[protein]-cysteine S-methyltransferase
MSTFFYETDIGKITITENNGFITNLYFPKDELPKELLLQETPMLKEAAKQLESYLSGRLFGFTLPLLPMGTDFMKRVWKVLCEIPYGKTASYKEIAIKLNSPKAYRAVGLANNRNPIPIFIPCHRVIGANGSLIGYRGGLELKRQLIMLEKIEK